jgi:signal transduction histidine kinase
VAARQNLRDRRRISNYRSSGCANSQYRRAQGPVRTAQRLRAVVDTPDHRIRRRSRRDLPSPKGGGWITGGCAGPGRRVSASELVQGLPPIQENLRTCLTGVAINEGCVGDVVFDPSIRRDATRGRRHRRVRSGLGCYAAVRAEGGQALEAQLFQAQKMETIGTLAGGIAHDFNNILSPILGYTDLALSLLETNHPVREDIEQVFRAAHRA